MSTAGPDGRPATHLRRIELFLSLIAFTLLAATLAQRGTQIERAKAELAEIARVLGHWDGVWLDRCVGTLASPRFSAAARTWEVSDHDRALGGLAIRRTWCLRPSRDSDFERSWPHWMTERVPGGVMQTPFGPQRLSQAAPPLHFEGAEYPRPRTLPDFRTFWDHLGHVDYWYVGHYEPRTLFIYPSPYSGMPAAILDQFRPGYSGTCDSLDLRFRDAVGMVRPPEGVANWTERDSTWHFFHGLVVNPADSTNPSAMSRLALAASAVSDSADVRAQFISDTGVRADNRAFREAFPNLVAVTALYPELSVDTLQVLLDEEFLRTNVDVGLLGARVPRSAIAVVGPLLLCLAQLYLLAHLRLLRHLPPQLDLEWLGTTGSFFAWLVSLVAAVILPDIAGFCAFTTFSSWRNSTTLLGAVALLGVGIASVMIVRTMWAIRRALVRPPGRSAEPSQGSHRSGGA